VHEHDLETPDEFQSQLYRDVIEPNIKEGATLAFAHGFSVLYKRKKEQRYVHYQKHLGGLQLGQEHLSHVGTLNVQSTLP
jgi:hypothetical protein